MKIIVRLISSFLLLFIFGNAYSGSCVGCKIESIGTGPYYDRTCTSSTCTFIRMNATGGTLVRPSCSSNGNWHYILDTSSSSGKAALSQLLTAYAAGKTINIGGLDNCTLFNGSEDFDYVYFTW